MLKTLLIIIGIIIIFIFISLTLINFYVKMINNNFCCANQKLLEISRNVNEKTVKYQCKNCGSIVYKDIN